MKLAIPIDSLAILLIENAINSHEDMLIKNCSRQFDILRVSVLLNYLQHGDLILDHAVFLLTNPEYVQREVIFYLTISLKWGHSHEIDIRPRQVLRINDGSVKIVDAYKEHKLLYGDA